MAETKAEKRKIRKLNGKSARQSMIDVPLMIKEVKNRSCLWDPKSPGYGDRRSVLEMWGQVSGVMGAEVDTLKMKWKNLRDTHRRIVKQDLLETPNKSNWIYLKDMEFLIGVLDINVEVDEDEVPKKIKLEQSSHESHDSEIDPTDYLDTFSGEHGSQDVPVHNSLDYNDNDYDLMYLKSLLPFFKTLEPYRKLLVRNKIQDVLLTEMAAQGHQNRSN